MSDIVTVTGTVATLFAHRFTLDTAAGPVLADLGPKGAALIALAPGETVTLTGERKPSEIKVTSVKRGTQSVDIPHGDKGGDKGGDLAPVPVAPVLAAVERAGLRPVGEPRRKPKHFEVLARDAEGQHHELHVEFDGTVRKRKPVAAA